MNKLVYFQSFRTNTSGSLDQLSKKSVSLLILGYMHIWYFYGNHKVSFMSTDKREGKANRRSSKNTASSRRYTNIQHLLYSMLIKMRQATQHFHSRSRFNILYSTIKHRAVAHNLAGIRLEQIKLNANLIGSPITCDCNVTWLPEAILCTSLLLSVEEYVYMCVGIIKLWKCLIRAYFHQWQRQHKWTTWCCPETSESLISAELQ